MTCLTSTCAFGGRPAGPFFADEHVVAVGQLEHSFLHSSSAVCFLVSFFVIGCLVKNVVLYSHQLFFACNKDVERSAKQQGDHSLIQSMSAKYGLTTSSGVPSGASALEHTAGFPHKGLITAPISMVQGITDCGTMVIQVLAHRMDRSSIPVRSFRLNVTLNLISVNKPVQR